MLAGRAFTWHDDKNAPRVAVVNREFARKIFGSQTETQSADITRCRMERASRWWALWKTESIRTSPKIRSRRCFSHPAIAVELRHGWWCARTAIRSNWRRPSGSTLRDLDPGLPFTSRRGTEELDSALFASRVATVSLGVLGVMGAMLAITGIFGMAAYSVSKRLRELGIRIALGAQRKEVLQAALGRAFQIAGIWFGGGIGSGTSGDPGAGLHRVSGDSARSAGAGRRCSGHGVAGAAGYVDSSATRAVGDPLMLLREE